MGCNTHGVVMTENKDISKIFRILKTSLVELMEKESGLQGIRLWHDESKQYTSPQGNLWDFTESFDVTFTYKGENRQLSVHLTCDSDYETEHKSLKGKKIILSLGAWGASVEIIQACLVELKELGGCYLQENDCSTDNWKKIK